MTISALRPTRNEHGAYQVPTNNIVERCIAWNAARYDQQYDYALLVKLLMEETMELYKATDPIDKLDGIADITFVAIGGLWKLGFSTEHIISYFYEVDLAMIDVEREAQSWIMDIQGHAFEVIDEDIPAAFPGLALICHSAFITALGMLAGMGMQSLYYDIIMAVCDSNDTKVIKGKTAANVKANIDKGDTFVPPTEKLGDLYCEFIQQQHEAASCILLLKK